MDIVKEETELYLPETKKKLFVGCWEMIRIVPDATRCCRDACPLLRVEGRLNEAERERMFHFSLSDPASLPLSDFHSNSVTHQLPHFAFPGMFFSLSFGRRAHPACVTQTRLHPIRPLPLVRWNHHLDGYFGSSSRLICRRTHMAYLIHQCWWKCEQNRQVTLHTNYFLLRFCSDEVNHVGRWQLVVLVVLESVFFFFSLFSFSPTVEGTRQQTLPG